jgi:hypothetical protein
MRAGRASRGASRGLIGALAAALALLAGPLVTLAGEADPWLAKGKAALEAREPAAAVEALEHARAAEPGRADVCHQLARAYEMDGQAPNALAMFAEAARLDAGGPAAAAARADARRLRERWAEIEMAQGDEYRGRRRFREAQECYVNAFEIAEARDAERRARARERYAQAAAAEIAAGALRGKGEGAAVALLPFEGVEPGTPLADLAALVADEVARQVKAAKGRVLPPSAEGGAAARVTGTLGSRLLLRALAAGAGGEVLAQVALKVLALEGEEAAAGRSPATDTPAAAAADLGRRLAEAIAEKAPGATVALAPLALEGEKGRARQLRELLEQLVGIELRARAQGRFRLLERGADGGAAVRVTGTVLAGDPLATVRLEARAGEKALVAASTTFGCPSTAYGKPLRLQVEVFAQTRDESGAYRDVQVYPDRALRSGDQLQVHFRTSRPCYVYVLLYSSGTNEAARVFPAENIAIGNHVEGERTVVLPAPELWFVLDDAVGTESLYVFAADEPLDDIDRLLERIRDGGVNLAREAAERHARSSIDEWVSTRGVKAHHAKSKTGAGGGAAKAKQHAETIDAEGRVVFSITFRHVP